MRIYRFLIIVSYLLTSILSAAPLKLAILGDSITWGAAAKVRENNCYAARLGHLLGEDYTVKTFAGASLCMLRHADKPFVATTHLKEALAFKPDIALIMLGTNDTCQNDQRHNWEHHADLQNDALFLIKKLRQANPKIIIHLLSPPPIFPNQRSLKPHRKAELTERSKRLPAIHLAYAAAAEQDSATYFHDLTRALLTNSTTDGVHPNTFAHEILAHHLYDLLAVPPGKRANLSSITKTSSLWNGFKQYKFTLTNTKAPCKLVIPHTARQGQPWILRARFWGHQPELDLALLDRGYHLAYCDVTALFGNKKAIARYAELHTLLTEKFSLNPKVTLEGMSRGGLIVLNYAAAYPQNIAAIYGDNPVCNFNSWPGGETGRFSKNDWKKCLSAYNITEAEAATYPQITDPAFSKKLAPSQIPIALVLGAVDNVVPISENGAALATQYAKAGGPIKVWLKPGKNHHPHGLHPVGPLLRILLRANHPTLKAPANIPSPSSEYRGGAGWGGNWWQAFENIKTQAKEAPDTQLVFLGDSISQGLTKHYKRATTPNGKRSIDRHFGSFKAFSLGLSGDRTEHLLWRLKHGQLDDLTPSHLVLMIGVNNLNRGHTGEEVAKGTMSIVKWLRSHRPEIKILLLGCFPTGKKPDLPVRAEVDTLHRLIKPLADNKNIFYQDLRPLFLNEDGGLNRCMRGDGIHPNARGFEVWMKAVEGFTQK